MNKFMLLHDFLKEDNRQKQEIKEKLGSIGRKQKIHEELLNIKGIYYKLYNI